MENKNTNLSVESPNQLLISSLAGSAGSVCVPSESAIAIASGAVRGSRFLSAPPLFAFRGADEWLGGGAKCKLHFQALFGNHFGLEFDVFSVLHCSITST